MAKFDIRSALNLSGEEGADLVASEAVYIVDMIPLKRIRPTEYNFYGMRGIEELAKDIEIHGLIHNITVRKLGDEYEIIDGERRYRAYSMLFENGNNDFDRIPCRVLLDVDDILAQIIMIQSNALGRERTEYEKMEEAISLKTLYEEQKKQGEKVPGRIRERAAKKVKISPSKMAIYEIINNNLEPEQKQEFKSGKIGVSKAYELAKENRIREARGNAPMPIEHRTKNSVVCPLCGRKHTLAEMQDFLSSVPRSELFEMNFACSGCGKGFLASCEKVDYFFVTKEREGI